MPPLVGRTRVYLRAGPASDDSQGSQDRPDERLSSPLVSSSSSIYSASSTFTLSTSTSSPSSVSSTLPSSIPSTSVSSTIFSPLSSSSHTFLPTGALNNGAAPQSLGPSVRHTTLFGQIPVAETPLPASTSGFTSILTPAAESVPSVPHSTSSASAGLSDPGTSLGPASLEPSDELSSASTRAPQAVADQTSASENGILTTFTSHTVVSVPVATFTGPSNTLTSFSLSTSAIMATATVAPVTTVQTAHASNSKRNAIIAGVVGGLGGLLLIVLLSVFFILRWRRRRRSAVEWETVRGSMFTRHTPSPRTPPVPPPPAPSTPQASQVTSHDLTSPHKPNISPLLIVHHAPHSIGLLTPDDDRADPFADPMAVARARSRIKSMSPTIRVSETEQVIKGVTPATSQNSGSRADVKSAYLMPPPPLTPGALGKANRLSNASVVMELTTSPPASNEGFAV